jgi:hypothetical protein
MIDIGKSSWNRGHRISIQATQFEMVRKSGPLDSSVSSPYRTEPRIESNPGSSAAQPLMDCLHGHSGRKIARPVRRPKGSKLQGIAGRRCVRGARGVAWFNKIRTCRALWEARGWGWGSDADQADLDVTRGRGGAGARGRLGRSGEVGAAPQPARRERPRSAEPAKSSAGPAAGPPAARAVFLQVDWLPLVRAW